MASIFRYKINIQIKLQKKKKTICAVHKSDAIVCTFVLSQVLTPNTFHLPIQNYTTLSVHILLLITRVTRFDVCILSASLYIRLHAQPRTLSKTE